MKTTKFCAHLWLPCRGRLYRQIRCPRCGAVRKVAPRWRQPQPRTIGEALSEAVRAGVMRADENRWRRTILDG